MGETQFEFKAGKFEFNALNFEYLVVDGAKAQFRGSGNIVGDRSGYGFIMTVIDGQAPGGGGVDRIRMKVFNKQTGAIVYDSQPGASDAADPAIAVGAGSTIDIIGGSATATASKLVLADPPDGEAYELRVTAVPNPSFDSFRVSVTSDSYEEAITLQVYDLTAGWWRQGP